MALSIADLTGTVIPPSIDYPYGDVKNAPNGTRVDRNMVTDLLQTSQVVMDRNFIVPNGSPDNLADGYQLFEAWQAEIFRGGNVPALTTPAYSGTYIASPTSPIKFRQGVGLMVVIKGRINNSAPAGGVSSDQEVFVLPTDHRPAEDQMFLCPDAVSGSVAYVTITAATGSVKILGTVEPFDNTGVFLNITFMRD